MRTLMGHWPQEIYWSYFRIAHLQEALGHPLDEVLTSFEKASKVVPDRAEALHAAALRCRVNNRYQQAYELTARGLVIAPPTNSLFHQPWVYDYGLLDEFAISAYWVGRYRECLKACDRLFSEGKCPATMLDRIRQNRAYAAEKLAAQVETVNVEPAA
jgi:tetratricopeptide (TPR) repeat protein